MRNASAGAATLLQRRWSLPDLFESWDEFDALVPVCTKADLREIVEEAGPEAFQGCEWRATAGTTGEPFRFPVSPDEAGGHVLAMWAARQRLGARADARVSLIWGHAHVLGSGVGGMIGKAKRQLADKVLGYQRISAYDLTDAALFTAGKQIIRHRPDLLIGYSNALDRFVETNADHQHIINRLPLKLVIATGEGFASPAAEARVRGFFRAPVRMEYGSMETGVMAYQFSDEGYETLWQRHRLECAADEAGADRTTGNALPVVVTSLYPRALPVWRYEIGDCIEHFAEDENPRLRFANVRGRSNLLIRLPGGEEIHSEAISHVVREVQAIRAFQFVVPGSQDPTILRYLGPRPLTPEEVDTLGRRLSRVSATLSSVTFQHSAELGQSPAGKHAMVVYGDLVKEDRV